MLRWGMRTLSAATFGGWLVVAFCLWAPASWLDPALGKRVGDIALPMVLLLQLIDMVVGWPNRQIPADFRRPSEAWIGVTVIGLVGLAGAVGFGWIAESRAGHLIAAITAAAILISTAILAVAAYRNADRNADRIGQARSRVPNP